MNRQIKYRVWDVLNRKMLDWEQIRGTEVNIADATFGAVDKWVPLIVIAFNGSAHATNRYVPLQYTGLIDKSGKDVYEGDIIRHQWSNVLNEKNTKTYQIIWFNGTVDFNGTEYAQLHSGFAAKLIANKTLIQAGELILHEVAPNDITGVGQEFEFTNYGTNGEPETKDCEVIGNIFENPELLKP